MITSPISVFPFVSNKKSHFAYITLFWDWIHIPAEYGVDTFLHTSMSTSQECSNFDPDWKGCQNCPGHRTIESKLPDGRVLQVCRGAHQLMLLQLTAEKLPSDIPEATAMHT
jgi:hypothetical protein